MRPGIVFDDTPRHVEARLIEGYRRMPPGEKLRRVVSLNDALDTLARARIRDERGRDVSEREIRMRLASLRLPRRTMVEVFGWDPREHGY